MGVLQSTPCSAPFPLIFVTPVHFVLSDLISAELFNSNFITFLHLLLSFLFSPSFEEFVHFCLSVGVKQNSLKILLERILSDGWVTGEGKPFGLNWTLDVIFQDF